MSGYLFGGNTGETPQSIARKRAVAEALMARATGRVPRNTGEGLNAVGQALAGVIKERRTDRLEAGGRAQGEAAFQSLFGGGDVSPMPLTPEDAPASASMPTPAGASALPASLIQSESGGDFAAFNDIPGSGGTGHFGRGQFSRGRLQDAMNAGVIPQGTTPEAFMADPSMQQAVEQWHVGDVQNFIDQNNLGRFVGQSINGTEVTPNGMLAVAHLGGSGGLQRFLETGGQYNPSDANGTSLSDYLTMHGGDQAQRPIGQQVAQATPQAGPGVSMDVLMQAVSNPWLTQGQRSVVEAMLQQQMHANDPMRQLQMQQLQQELQTGAPGYISPVDQQRLDLDRQRFAFEREGAGRTDDTSEYEFYAQQERAAGREPVPYLDFITAQRRAGAASTNVNLPGQPEIGTIPQGFEVITDPETGARSMRRIPGGPEDTSANDAAQAESTARTANIVLEDIGRIKAMMDDGGPPVAGALGGALSRVPGNDAFDTRQLLTTIRANIGFDRLQQMREASPTGGALGNVTIGELERLEAVLGALGQSQSQGQFRENLDRLETIYTDILNKAAAYPNAAEFGFQPVANDEFTGISRDGLLNMDLNDMNEDQLRRWMQRMDELDND